MDQAVADFQRQYDSLHAQVSGFQTQISDFQKILMTLSKTVFDSSRSSEDSVNRGPAGGPEIIKVIEKLSKLHEELKQFSYLMCDRSSAMIREVVPQSTRSRYGVKDDVDSLDHFYSCYLLGVLSTLLFPLKIRDSDRDKQLLSVDLKARVQADLGEAALPKIKSSTDEKDLRRFADEALEIVSALSKNGSLGRLVFANPEEALQPLIHERKNSLSDESELVVKFTVFPGYAIRDSFRCKVHVWIGRRTAIAWEAATVGNPIEGPQGS